MIKPIAITLGEPAGIGPELVLKLLQEKWPVPLVILGCRQTLLAYSEALSLPLGNIPLIDIPTAVPVTPGKLTVHNAKSVLCLLERAAQGALSGEFSAIVTGPVHKGIINEAGIAFSGHTEFFAQASGIPKPVMMLMNASARVALVTTHLALSEVPKQITFQNLTETLQIVHTALIQQFKIVSPRIGVCGLNPHAGENGCFGTEEITVISPALDYLRQNHGFHLLGPLPADTAFLPQQLKQVDAIVALYHDQGLPVIKQMDFAHTVNVTLGLPFIRTSVDHGTALELAGKGIADHRSFRAALQTAIDLMGNPADLPNNFFTD